VALGASPMLMSAGGGAEVVLGHTARPIVGREGTISATGAQGIQQGGQVPGPASGLAKWHLSGRHSGAGDESGPLQ